MSPARRMLQRVVAVLATTAGVGLLVGVAAAAAGVSEALRRRLNDPSRNVRLAAAWSLRASLDPASPAGRELRHFLEVSADQPGSTGQARASASFIR